ncbi:AcrB/AcrD/AcrF family protein [candidate division KSB1 bacterium]|nr:MAG: AcrB/AcrD/AcrF family protein [candidate division KSB1 bacterium]
MAHKSDNWFIQNTHNTARFFTENRHISWMVLVATVVWGIFGYFKMPQRKDPDIPVRVAVAICSWPGVATEKVEQLVTRKIEEKMAENITVKRIESTTRVGVSFVYVTLQDNIEETGKQFDDIKLKLDDLQASLPDGVQPINFIKDFGSTAALMLTVASPKIGEVEISLRAKAVQRALEQARAPFYTNGANERMAIIYWFPPSVEQDLAKRRFEAFVRLAQNEGVLRDPRLIEGSGFLGVDGISDYDDAKMHAYIQHYIKDHLRIAELHPDGWPPIVIRNLEETEKKFAEAAGDKYTYRELNEFTELIKRTIQTVPQASKVDRAGVLDEAIYLAYSQERLAAYGSQTNNLRDILSARNTALPGGVVEYEGKNLAIAPTGEFKSEKEIGGVIVAASPNGSPVYLRDMVEINRSYDSPPRYMNFYTWRDAQGNWQRSRAVTLAIQMRPGEQIGKFGAAIDAALANVKHRLPEDLIFARTSDQPLQVAENIDLFMSSLYEAIALVVLIALVGFWEWRSAVLMALSIPLTLAMTFGMMYVLGVDLQQVSIASLIIALGLLVDDPVVAGDAIKRDLAIGHKPIIAAWLGPTKLATAILYATITNIVAYLPFLMLTGDMGRFLTTLPIVMTCSLVASRLVSMTFIPLLGYYLLRPSKKQELPMSERRQRGFAGWYYKIGHWAIAHRWKVFAGSLAFLALGGFFGSQLKSQFTPKDLSYFSYIDVWLPEDAPLSATREVTERVEAITRREIDEYGKAHAENGAPLDLLESLTTFVGGGGPRFWFSVSPEPRQTNYAQIIVQLKDKHATHHLVEPLQAAFSAEIAGARVNMRQLETSAIGIPVSIRLSGEDIPTLRAEAEKMKEIFRALPLADRVQDNWGAQSFVVNLEIDPDRANLAGVTNLDVAVSSAIAMNGYQVGELREGDKQIPVIARMRMEERSQLADLQNLYVYSSQSGQKVPLRQISSMNYTMQTEKIQRRNQFRTITVSCFSVAGVLPSEVLDAALPQLQEFEKKLPSGYQMEIGGEYEEQVKGFGELGIVMGISIAMIFMALVVQFKNAVKPLLVFAAIPYGIVGALAALWIMDMPFGFMGFLGVASLVGVIVSHVIVLFDFIEEAHERGESLIESLLDAGIMRLRPVMITVGATVFALFPLAAHGGPLWEPLCYAQIGGLTVATFITLLLVPVLYAIFVLDLKIVKWEKTADHDV